jgi:hypothetical protein
VTIISIPEYIEIPKFHCCPWNQNILSTCELTVIFCGSSTLFSALSFLYLKHKPVEFAMWLGDWTLSTCKKTWNLRHLLPVLQLFNSSVTLAKGTCTCKTYDFLVISWSLVQVLWDALCNRSNFVLIIPSFRATVCTSVHSETATFFFSRSFCINCEVIFECFAGSHSAVMHFIKPEFLYMGKVSGKLNREICKNAMKRRRNEKYYLCWWIVHISVLNVEQEDGHEKCIQSCTWKPPRNGTTREN